MLKLDLVTHVNKGQVLLHTRAVSGLFLWQRGSRVEGGYFLGAYGNIGDAVFMPEYVLRFDSERQALEWVFTRWAHEQRHGGLLPTQLFEGMSSYVTGDL